MEREAAAARKTLGSLEEKLHRCKHDCRVLQGERRNELADIADRRREAMKSLEELGVDMPAAAHGKRAIGESRADALVVADTTAYRALPPAASAPLIPLVGLPSVVIRSCCFNVLRFQPRSACRWNFLPI